VEVLVIVGGGAGARGVRGALEGRDVSAVPGSRAKPGGEWRPRGGAGTAAPDAAAIGVAAPRTRC